VVGAAFDGVQEMKAGDAAAGTLAGPLLESEQDHRAVEGFGNP
jgi:hypothetical protein